MIMSSTKKILLDADVIIHFFKGGKLRLLPKIFPNRLNILDIVFEEIKGSKIITVIDNLIENGEIDYIEFPNSDLYNKEYASLRSEKMSFYGKGESACMVYARYNKQFIASCNYRDIRRYCDFHNIEHFNTLDILDIAVRKNLLSDSDRKNFIELVIRKGSILPFPKVKKKS